MYSVVLMKVNFYTIPGDAVTKTAEEFLRRNNIVYEIIDVSENNEARREAIKKSRSSRLPVFEIKRAHSIGVVSGFDEYTLSSMLGIRKQ